MKKLGRAAVDTGMLLIIDPSYLFTHAEWMGEIRNRADNLGGDYPKAILQALADRTGQKIEKLAVIADVDGDGRRQVVEHEEGIFIEK